MTTLYNRVNRLLYRDRSYLNNMATKTKKTTNKQKPITSKKTPHKSRSKHLEVVKETSVIGRFYVAISLIVLFASTTFWSFLSARLQQGNADQLVNTFLFERSTTFRNAVLPSQHSFLIKWPLFLLIKFLGSTPAAFIGVTVATVLLTVAFFVYILHKIEKRPIVFGTICLGLASVLLLIPAMPYPGGILPVNMAMLATRNLEYVLYIVSLIVFVRAPRFKSWNFWVSTTLLTLLIASDKLFLIFSLGGALLALTAYSLSKGWNMVSLAVHWLLSGLIATATASGLLLMLSRYGVTKFFAPNTASPYSFIHGVHDLFLGGIYLVIGLLTNFGINPASDARLLRDVSHQIIRYILSTGLLPLVVNLTFLGVGLVGLWQIIRASLAHNRDRQIKLETSSKLSILLIWTTLAAFIAFLATSHYYPVDARYLTIAMFTVFVSLASYQKQKKWPTKKLLIVGGTSILGIIFALPIAIKTYHNEAVALSDVNSRNSKIADALKSHPNTTLVGDYWRVVPTKSLAGSNQNITPLADCSTNRRELSSHAWQPDLEKTKFAYLLSLDANLTNSPRCNIDQATYFYGRPNSSTLISGTLSKPKELLLFYDSGLKKSAPVSLLKNPSTILPVPLEDLPNTSCMSPTIMNIVAHEDDDILFMNPDLLHDIKAGHCVRTVFVTAGDAGSHKLYWLGRQQGAEAAYLKMTGGNEIWIERIVQIDTNIFITVANPKGNPKISLLFMHIPDGNVRGEGFGSTNKENLIKLESGAIKLVHTVDGQSFYDSEQLKYALTNLMHVYQPSEIRTQSSFTTKETPDHPDHMVVGRYVQSAYKDYIQQKYEGKVTIPMKFYVGYPIRKMPQNIFGKDLDDKEAAFFAYSKHDGAVCQTHLLCNKSNSYNFYLDRQYQHPF